MNTFVLKVEKELGLKWQLQIVGPGERVVVERPLGGSKLDQFAIDSQTSYGRKASSLSDLPAQLSEWLTGLTNQRLDDPGSSPPASSSTSRPITVAGRHTQAQVYLAVNRDEESDALQKAD